MLEIYRPSRQRLPGQGTFPHRAWAARDPDPVVVLQRWVDRARQLGASVAEPPTESFGAEAWMLDPEGNALLLLVPRPPVSKQREFQPGCLPQLPPAGGFDPAVGRDQPGQSIGSTDADW